MHLSLDQWQASLAAAKLEARELCERMMVFGRTIIELADGLDEDERSELAGSLRILADTVESLDEE